tara:strand:+ start:418 stop:1092 length:675 start_codon:yes stop_codon:yes gene_type:complete
MDQDALKRSAAKAALEYVEPRLTNKSIIGVGTGSTTNFFIRLLASIRHKFDAAVSSSHASTRLLEESNIKVISLTAANDLSIYVDGADEATRDGMLIKGGGGALTREKIVAASSQEFVCIIDESKLVNRLGAFPLPIEVIPMARGLVGRALVALGGSPILREDFVTDNGNIILDVHNLDITDPVYLEKEINQLVGVICCGVFAKNRATQLIIGKNDGAVEQVSL